MKSIKTYKVLLILVSILCFGICHAQTYSFNGVFTPNVTVQPVMSIEITPNPLGSINFISTSQFSEGIFIPNFAIVQIKSNVTWAFNVSTVTPYFSASGSYSTPNMPAQVLSMRSSNQTQYQQLTTTSKTLTKGNRGSVSVPGNTFDLSLLADPKYEYGPGIYSITINYTLTAQ